MSTDIERRITRLEQANAPDIAPDQRDPKLVGLYRSIFGPDYPEEKIPMGVSGAEVVDYLLWRVEGTCFKPVTLDPADREWWANSSAQPAD